MSNQPPYPPPPPPPPPPPGGNPYGGNPYGNNPQGGNPYGGNPYGNNPQGGNPYGNNPYGNNPYGNMPPGNNPYQQNPLGMQRDLPNATAILVLGIVSIVGCFCWGVVGLGCGIAALVMSQKALAMYNENPAAFTRASYNNANAGKICAIIGTIISALAFILFLVGLFTDNHEYYYHWY